MAPGNCQGEPLSPLISHPSASVLAACNHACTTPTSKPYPTIGQGPESPWLALQRPVRGLSGLPIAHKKAPD